MDRPDDWRLVEAERRVLNAAAAIGGVDASKVWFEIPIPDLGGFSPREMVAQGQAREVLEYLALMEVPRPLYEGRAA